MRWNPKILSFRGARWVAWGLALAIALPLAWQRYRDLQPYNDFDLKGASVDPRRIESGGPGRDGIPALTDPAVMPAEQASFLRDDDTVLGLSLAGHARAYPLKILNWHEVVNDRLGNQAVAVTYCPLCGTGIAFSAMLGGQRLDFGVSGLLYQDNLLFYDRATQSLWSQFTGEAVSGARRGTRLEPVPIEHATWREWRQRYPHTSVLALPRWSRRDYDVDPYREYRLAGRAVSGEEGMQAMPPNAWVIGLAQGGRAKAWPLAALARQAPKGVLEDTLAGVALRIEYDAPAGHAVVRDAGGRLLPGILSYWFAWKDFHPKTLVWQPPRDDTSPSGPRAVLAR